MNTEVIRGSAVEDVQAGLLAGAGKALVDPRARSLDRVQQPSLSETHSVLAFQTAGSHRRSHLFLPSNKLQLRNNRIIFVSSLSS